MYNRSVMCPCRRRLIQAPQSRHGRRCVVGSVRRKGASAFIRVVVTAVMTILLGRIRWEVRSYHHLSFSLLPPCHYYYVGMTRHKNRHWMVSSGRRRRRGNTQLLRHLHRDDDSSTAAAADATAAKKSIGVGIDLGTTNSAVAYLKHGRIPTMVTLSSLTGDVTLPSIVSIRDDDDDNSATTTTTNVLDPATTRVGKSALRPEANDNDDDDDDTHQRRIVYRNVKRIIGTGGNVAALARTSFVVPHVRISPTGHTYTKKPNVWNQLYDSIHHPTLLWRRTQRRTKHNNDTLTPDDDWYIRPEVVSAYILQHLKQTAEQHLNVTVDRAVIGIPAYFHEGQRNATLNAARDAGFVNVKLLREPEAAALAYGFTPPSTLPHGSPRVKNDNDDDDELVLVFDLGGGTYDVSILYTSGRRGSDDDGDAPIMEIIATSGNTELGGSTFDSRIALHLQQQIRQYQTTASTETSKIKPVPNSILVLSAEAIRIYLSNHRMVHLLFPIQQDDWYTTIATHPSSVIVAAPSSYDNNAPSNLKSNATHYYMTLTRKEMETICTEEILALLRPLREVAIMANALLPGDSSPAVVAAAALDDDDQDFVGYTRPFDNFYSDDSVKNDNDVDNEANQLLATMTSSSSSSSSKKLQQQGRKRARDVAKEERKYRQAKKNIALSSSPGVGGPKTRLASSPSSASKMMKNPKVRDGISGRPISRIVLVGGATRMPCIGRLLTVVTGVVPQRTVNPDEAVALGCAIQVGIYDGQPNMGTVLSPIQAAILRATSTRSASRMTSLDDDDDDDDDDDFDDGIVYAR